MPNATEAATDRKSIMSHAKSILWETGEWPTYCRVARDLGVQPASVFLKVRTEVNRGDVMARLWQAARAGKQGCR